MLKLSRSNKFATEPMYYNSNKQAKTIFHFCRELVFLVVIFDNEELRSIGEFILRSLFLLAIWSVISTAILKYRPDRKISCSTKRYVAAKLSIEVTSLLRNRCIITQTNKQTIDGTKQTKYTNKKKD